jgi:hypothetical protein
LGADQQQAADLIAKSRWRTQPATVTKAGKLYLPAVQGLGADHKAGKLYLPAVQGLERIKICRGSNRRWMKVQWHVSAHMARSAFIVSVARRLGTQ